MIDDDDDDWIVDDDHDDDPNGTLLLLKIDERIDERIGGGDGLLCPVYYY